MIRLATIAAIVYIWHLISAHSILAAPSEGSSDKVFIGYVVGLPKDINYSMYTHLCHAFVVAEKDGSLIPKEHVPSRQLTRDAHKAGVNVLLALGGWGWDENFSAMSLDSLAEDRYVTTIMRIVEEYDYDGIDLDWEYPDTNIEIVGFERLARRFRKLLDELEERKDSPMVLTMAAAAHPKTLQWLSNEFLLETMNWVNIMTYDYTGSWADCAGHHAPLFASSKLTEEDARSIELTMKYLVAERGLPPSRLTLGLPLYGRVFAVSEPYAPNVDLPKPSRQSINYSEIHHLHARKNWKRQWDNETKNPWLAAPDGAEVICYDDGESIAIKTEWAIRQGFRGVFFWQIDADRLPDGSNPLQRISCERLFQKVP